MQASGVELWASNMPPSRREILKECRRLYGALFSTAVLTATIALCSWAIPQSAPATAKAGDSNSAPQVVFRKLVHPVIESGMIALSGGGDVVLKISVRPDGTIAFVTTVSGNSSLAEAAMESARHSEIECPGCHGLTEKFLTYSFRISPVRAGPCCCTSGHPDSQLPTTQEFSEVNGHITIIAPPICVCPDSCSLAWAEAHSKFRSPKCLYLWKCGKRRVGII